MRIEFNFDYEKEYEPLAHAYFSCINTVDVPDIVAPIYKHGGYLKIDLSVCERCEDIECRQKNYAEIFDAIGEKVCELK